MNTYIYLFDRNYFDEETIKNMDESNLMNQCTIFLTLRGWQNYENYNRDLYILRKVVKKIK